jgi:hypothetical protein
VEAKLREHLERQCLGTALQHHMSVSKVFRELISYQGAFVEGCDNIANQIQFSAKASSFASAGADVRGGGGTSFNISISAGTSMSNIWNDTEDDAAPLSANNYRSV